MLVKTTNMSNVGEYERQMNNYLISDFYITMRHVRCNKNSLPFLIDKFTCNILRTINRNSL